MQIVTCPSCNEEAPWFEARYHWWETSNRMTIEIPLDPPAELAQLADLRRQEFDIEQTMSILDAANLRLVKPGKHDRKGWD
jgi:hypothetical protein